MLRVSGDTHHLPLSGEVRQLRGFIYHVGLYSQTEQGSNSSLVIS